MSVIIEENGKNKLYVKGADNIILGLRAKEGQRFVTNVENKLSEYSLKGWRTLVIAMKTLD